jgi:hypothetical protein
MRQAVQTQMHEVHTKSIDIPATQLPVSRARSESGQWAPLAGWLLKMAATVHGKNPTRVSPPTCSP